MTKSYVPVKGGPPKRKKASNPTGTKIPTITKSEIRNVEKVDELLPTVETFEHITQLSSQGYSPRSMAYLLGVTKDVFDEFNMMYPSEVSEAITLGHVIDETECLSIFRSAATDKRSGSFATLLQAYGKMKFGWSGGAGGEANDLPSGMKLFIKQPDDIDE